MIELSIGIGLFLSIIFSEVFGLAAGGMVVPGYLALELDNPGRLLTTMVIALATFGVVRIIAQTMIIYGRRRTAVMILVGFLLRVVVDQFLSAALPEQTAAMASIGFIIPGLLALWMERQGVIETVCTGILAAVMVKLCLILAAGWGIVA